MSECQERNRQMALDFYDQMFNIGWRGPTPGTIEFKRAFADGDHAILHCHPTRREKIGTEWGGVRWVRS